MVEEATKCREGAKKEQFYPCPSTALGVESSMYVKSYPQIYHGHALNGCPVFISKPGQLDMNTIECLTSIDGIINFHWYAMMHEFAGKLREQQIKSEGNFKRFECVCILDLKELTHAQLSRRPLNIIKAQSSIDSLCFPETLNRMVIVNAPSFFTITWKVIRGWIDARTANKVTLIGSNMIKMRETLAKIVDLNELPIDYGGDGDSVDNMIHSNIVKEMKDNQTKGPELKNRELHHLSIRGKKTHFVEVPKGTYVKVSLFTKSRAGGVLSIRYQGEIVSSNLSTSSIPIEFKGKGEEVDHELPTRFDLEDYGIVFDCPGTYEMTVDSNASRYSTVSILVTLSEYSKTPSPEYTNYDFLSLRAGGNFKAVLSPKSLCVGIVDGNDVIIDVSESTGENGTENPTRSNGIEDESALLPENPSIKRVTNSGGDFLISSPSPRSKR